MPIVFQFVKSHFDGSGIRRLFAVRHPPLGIISRVAHFLQFGDF